MLVVSWRRFIQGEWCVDVLLVSLNSGSVMHEVESKRGPTDVDALALAKGGLDTGGLGVGVHPGQSQLRLHVVVLERSSRCGS